MFSFLLAGRAQLEGEVPLGYCCRLRMPVSLAAAS